MPITMKLGGFVSIEVRSTGASDGSLHRNDEINNTEISEVLAEVLLQEGRHGDRC